MLKKETRTYLYGIATAASPLLITFGIMSEGTTQQIVLVVAAILGVTAPGLAKANVPKVDEPGSATVPLFTVKS
jgi:hypothetical protein